MKKLDIRPGQRFTRLTIVRETEPRVRSGITFRRFLCRCDCGAERSVEMIHLTRKRHPTRSCGCYAHEKIHGHASGGKISAEYQVWAQVVGRCTNSKHISYPNYGGRGIEICERWSRFENFIDDMGCRPSPKHSIDRIDNDGNYEPENCQWVTKHEQSRNTRQNVWLTLNGRTMVQSDWAKELGIGVPSLMGRLRRGWSLDRALTERKFR